MGVSFDKTHHIQTTILNKWFPKGSTERIRAEDMPYWTGSNFEWDIELQLPSMDTELSQLEKEFGDKYNAFIGQYKHIV